MVRRPNIVPRLLAMALIGSGVGLVPLIANATNGDVSREELDALEAERADALSRLAALEAAEEAVTSDLGTLERELIAAALESQRREEQATAAELKLLSLRARLRSARDDLVGNETALEDLIASLSVTGRHRPPVLLTQPQDANQAIRAAILMGEVAPEVQNRTTALTEEIDALRRIEREILREQKRLAAAEATLELKREEILQLTAAKRTAYEDVSADAKALRNRAELLGREAETIRSLIAALEASAPAAPRLKPILNFAQDRGPSSSPGPTVQASVSQPLGVLASPAAGRMIRRWGDALPGGSRSEGVAFATRGGAQVASPIDGVVEFSGPFRSYGQLLILSTSDGYHVLLSGMASNYVTVGQSVSRGEPVARMAERENGDAELYMELRKGGEPMNPAKWMKRG